MVEASAFGINKGSSCDTVAVKMLKGMELTGAVQPGEGHVLWGRLTQEQEGKRSEQESPPRLIGKALGIRPKPLPEASGSVGLAAHARDSVQRATPAPALSMQLLSQ